MSRVAAIILAAGASTRLGRPKQLVVFRNQTLLARTIAAAREVGCEIVITVLGAHAEACRAEAMAARIVINPEWQSGMASSIRIGLEAVPEADSALLLVCDQPHLDAAHLTALIDQARVNPNAIICSEYAQRRGVPALFPRHLFPMLQALTGGHGARAVLSRTDLPIIAVPWPAGATDIDDAGDVEALKAR